jgi:hypothetical protein
MLNTTDQPSAPAIDWASLGRSEFDLPGTSVGASRSRPDTHLSINRPDTHLTINLATLGRGEIAMPGDAAVLAMTTIAPKDNRKRTKTRCKSHQAAHRHVREFTLPGTCAGESRSRPDTQPTINLDTLGKSEHAMSGDDADPAMNAIAPKGNRKRKKKRSTIHQAAHRHHVHSPI